jgi:hypothetical protein
MSRIAMKAASVALLAVLLLAVRSQAATDHTLATVSPSCKEMWAAMVEKHYKSAACLPGMEKALSTASSDAAVCPDTAVGSATSKCIAISEVRARALASGKTISFASLRGCPARCDGGRGLREPCMHPCHHRHRRAGRHCLLGRLRQRLRDHEHRHRERPGVPLPTPACPSPSTARQPHPHPPAASPPPPQRASTAGEGEAELYERPSCFTTFDNVDAFKKYMTDSLAAAPAAAPAATPATATPTAVASTNATNATGSTPMPRSSTTPTATPSNSTKNGAAGLQLSGLLGLLAAAAALL